MSYRPRSRPKSIKGSLISAMGYYAPFENSLTQLRGAGTNTLTRTATTVTYDSAGTLVPVAANAGAFISGQFYNRNPAVFEGDSLTVGTGSTGGQNWPTQLLGLYVGTPYTAQNIALAGDTIQTMLASEEPQVASFYNAKNNANVCFVWAGTNDILGSRTAAQIYADLSAYCTYVRSLGFKVLVFTIQPASSAGAVAVGFNTVRATLNTSIRAGYTTFADGLVDIAADPTIGPDGASDNTTYYYTDKVHMVNAGYAIVAGIAKTALDAIIVPTVNAGVWVPDNGTVQGLTVSPTQQNLAVQSVNFSGWTPQNVGLNAGITSTFLAAPDPAYTWIKVNTAATTTTHYFQSPSITLVASGIVHACYYAKQGSGTLCVQIRAAGDGTVGKYANFDLTNGVKGTLGVGAIASQMDYLYTDVDGIKVYRISATWTQTATATSATVVLVQTANSAEFPTFLGNNSDYVLLWQGDFILGSIIGPPVYTGAVAATRDADIASETVASNISATQGTMTSYFTPNHAPIAGTSLFLGGSYVDANNYTAILHDGTNLIFRKRVATVNYDATIALAYVAGTEYHVGTYWDATRGTQISVNGVLGTGNANTTALQLGTTWQVGGDGNSANQLGGQYRINLISQSAVSDTQLKTLTL